MVANASPTQAYDADAALSSRMISNSVFNVLGWLWPICLNLVTMPYVVHTLGDEAFGVLALIQASVGFLSFMDLGLNAASIKFIAQYWSSHDTDAINKVVGVTLIAFAPVGLVGMLAIGLASNWLAASMLRVSGNLLPTAAAAFEVGALTFFANMVASAFSAVPFGLQRFDVSTKVTAAMATLTTIGTVGVLAMGGGLLQVVFARLTVSVCSVVAFFLAAKRLVPTLSMRPRWNWAVCRDLLSFGSANAVNRIAASLMLQLDRLLIGSMLGAAAVTYYVVPATAVQMVHQLLSNATIVLFPVSSALSNQGQSDLLRRLYVRVTKQFTALATLLYLPVVLLAPSILSLWMGEGFAQRSGSVFALLALSYYLFSYNIVAYHLVNGLGRPSLNAVSALAGGVIEVILCLTLVPRLGIVGAAVANFASMVRIPFYLLYVNARLIKVRAATLLRGAYCRPWLVVLLILVPTSLLQLSPRGLPALLATGAIIVLAYVTLAVLVGVFDAADGRILARWATRFIGRLHNGAEAMRLEKRERR